MTLALFAIVNGQAMAPPYLPGDAPGAYILHPRQINFSPPLREEFYFSFFYDFDPALCERLHPDEPLRRQPRLYHGVAAVTMPDSMAVRLLPYKEPALFQVLYYRLPRLEAVEPVKVPSVLVYRRVGVHHVYRLEGMPQTQFKVNRVVRRG